MGRVEAQAGRAGWCDVAPATSHLCAGGMSLRSAASGAAGCGIAHLSGVGLLKRLKGVIDWLSYGAAFLFDADIRSRNATRRLRVVDGSVIRSANTERRAAGLERALRRNAAGTNGRTRGAG